jgi:hypothetical protein
MTSSVDILGYVVGTWTPTRSILRLDSLSGT